MLQLKNITKDYTVSNELTVHALKNVTLNFRRNEFVSVLGPSGCGKTTLLNIIGGLDRYSEGDLLIDGKSTKNFKDGEWDNYRNEEIGFVFQSYNLIPHISVLENVALSLTLGGISKKERLQRAKEALERVGLGEQIKKRPNQLSGGQMQRVAIARAIVGNPNVVLADEPTGALDTETGIQVMELLKEISSDRLVILVTHNIDLAEKYSTRIVRLLDGELTGDSDPYTDEQLTRDTAASDVSSTATKAAPKGKRRFGKWWSSLTAAFGISFRNLCTKRGRTFLTSFAGSIGIFGIALVLAISGGMGNYVDYMQTEAVSDAAVTIGETAYSVNRILSIMGDMEGVDETPYPDKQYVVPYERESFHSSTSLTDDFIDYLNEMDSSWYSAMNFSYNINMNVLKGNKYLPTWSAYASQMVENDELIEDNYDVLYKAADSPTGYPKDKTEVSLVVNKFNRISPSTLKALNIPYTNDDGSYKPVPFEEIIAQGNYTLVLNDGWYYKVADRFVSLALALQNNELPTEAMERIGDNKLDVRIVSILRPKNDESMQWLTSGIAYLPELAEFMIDNAVSSEIGAAQLASKDRNVLTGAEFTVKVPNPNKPEEEAKQILSQYEDALKSIGAFKTPTSIKIYPKNIDSKQLITGYIEDWNSSHPDDEILYLDLTGLALSLMATFIDVVSWVLLAFSAVSLIVSTVMISVITYTSVVERTKEIGVLRSIGASKWDVSQIFNAETVIIGTFAGILGVGLALIVGMIANVVISSLFGVTGIAAFTPGIVLGMFALSVALTVLAGLIPARIAAKRDPVKCLRTE